MTNPTQKKGVSPIATAVGGVVVGVGLAVAGAMALKDKATSKKVEKGMDQMKSKANEMSKMVKNDVKDLNSQTEDVAKNVQDKAMSAKDEVVNKFNRTKETAKKIVKAIKEN